MTRRTSEVPASCCAFTYSDGRQCRMLRTTRSEFCFHHDRKLRHLREGDYTAAEICEPLSRSFVPATSLTRALTRTFQAVAESRIDPKTATALARVASALQKSLPLATAEFREIYKDEYWSQLVCDHHSELPPFIDEDEEGEEDQEEASGGSDNPEEANVATNAG